MDTYIKKVTETELNNNQKNNGAKRITLDALKNNIKKIDYYIHLDSQLTICILTLNNGFTVTGQSACADPKMFDENVGKRLAYTDAEKSIWPLMGYALKEEIYLMGEGSTFNDRLEKEYNDLISKIDKLNVFIKGSVLFETLDDYQRSLLNDQLNIMTRYSDILSKRLTGLNK